MTWATWVVWPCQSPQFPASAVAHPTCGHSHRCGVRPWVSGEGRFLADHRDVQLDSLKGFVWENAYHAGSSPSTLLSDFSENTCSHTSKLELWGPRGVQRCSNQMENPGAPLHPPSSPIPRPVGQGLGILVLPVIPKVQGLAQRTPPFITKSCIIKS